MNLIRLRTYLAILLAPVIPTLICWTLTSGGLAQEQPGHGKRDHKHTNELAKESSPYLLMHAHNPVNWYAWNAETLALAKKEDKPIFLSIGYSSCHWCHVMEHESFLDERSHRRRS